MKKVKLRELLAKRANKVEVKPTKKVTKKKKKGDE
jgi:hypothetical protein